MAIYRELERSSASSTVMRAPRTTDADVPEIGAEEVLIPDDRGNVRPGQMVQNKLSGMLPGASLPVSQLRFNELISRRS